MKTRLWEDFASAVSKAKPQKGVGVQGPTKGQVLTHRPGPEDEQIPPNIKPDFDKLVQRVIRLMASKYNRKLALSERHLPEEWGFMVQLDGEVRPGEKGLGRNGEEAPLTDITCFVYTDRDRAKHPESHYLGEDTRYWVIQYNRVVGKAKGSPDTISSLTQRTPDDAFAAFAGQIDLAHKRLRVAWMSV